MPKHHDVLLGRVAVTPLVARRTSVPAPDLRFYTSLLVRRPGPTSEIKKIPCMSVQVKGLGFLMSPSVSVNNDTTQTDLVCRLVVDPLFVPTEEVRTIV